jgi:hypothetical protein
MRRSIPILAIVLLTTMVILCTSQASAFEEMTGVTMLVSPSEANSGGDLDMTVTVANHNNRSLLVTVMTVQVYNGHAGWTEENQRYVVDVSDGLVPANGSKTFDVSGKAPKYVGSCSVTVVIAGIFDGDENASISGMMTYMTLNPNVGGFLVTGLLIVLVPIIAVVVGVVVAVYFFSRKDVPNPAYSRRCGWCGEVMSPGSTYCGRCGKNN